MKTLFILFQTDLHKSKESRVLCGVYSSQESAAEAASENNLCGFDSDIEIVESELDKFEEL